MVLTNITFDHTQSNVCDAIQGLAYHELMVETDRNWGLLMQEVKDSGKEGGCTSEFIEMVVKAIPDNLTKEEIAVIAAATMHCVMQKQSKSEDPLMAFLQMMKKDLGRLRKDLE